jgi:DNA-binding CsgD family transcriptional regulator
MRREVAQRTEREVARLVHEGLDWATLSLRAGQILRRAVPFDHACWHTVDPATMLFTGVTKDSLDDEVRLPYHEYALADVNKWADLARRPTPVGVLREATAGEPHRSPRYRELLAPRGISAEVRLALVADGACWGAAGIYRDAGRPDFSDQEAGLLARAGQRLAHGYRRALLLAAVERGVDGSDTRAAGPGVVLLDASGEVEHVDPVARAHLASLPDHAHGERPEVPAVVRAVAERARRGGESGEAKARVLTDDGRWLALYGSRLGPQTSGGRLAVIVEPVGPAELWPLVADLYDLTPREREITLLCLRGLSTAEMAQRLHLSIYTLQEYLSNIFDKVGVRARRALVAKVFTDVYWGPVAAGAMAGHRGGFAAET